jgi:hypothetical protein
MAFHVFNWFKLKRAQTRAGALLSASTAPSSKLGEVHTDQIVASCNMVLGSFR